MKQITCDMKYFMILYILSRVYDEKNKKVNWNIYYYVYSQKIQGKLHSYHEMNMKYYKVRDEKALYREAASYYINGFKLNEFLYNNF